MDDFFAAPTPRKKKETDHEALKSPLSRIPGMPIAATRDLIDLGFWNIDELQGRSPETLFDDLRKLRPKTPADRLGALRLAVYFAETPDPDPKKLQVWQWLE
ncbi:MAG: helix-hairpin-helix domain-containing protein [Verrucomicrobiota bacterium JB022]|nr:helix-hairpin-helix domain-containing protein [Verrucomicrobiota bacterium JB022]